MKLNKILMALSAMAIVGCSSEDFNDPSVTQAIDDSRLIQLDENFVLAGVGEVDNTTRTHWEWEDPATKKKLVNKFLPIWKTAPSGLTLDKYADLTAQSVGLCWLGQSVGTDVYTNYQFYHFGWLNKGVDKATFECNELKNGSLYSEITATAGTANAEAVPGTDWTVTGIPIKSWTTDNKDNLNYNSGIYKTDNKAIFGGQYIVYYPYNENFKDAGTIPAKAVTSFGVAGTTPINAPTALGAAELGKATFRYSAPVKIEGGNQAADFGLYNLSSLVQLRVAAPKGYSAGATFDQIVLYSAKEQLLEQANLAADKIAAGKKGTELYAEGETKGIKTIVANLKAAPLTLTATDGAVTSAYITVLPTTVEDLVVLVHSNSLNKWAKVSLPNTEFEAGAAKRLDITVADADFKADYIAVDEASLTTALTEANTAAATNPQTITVIGDITFDGPVSPATSRSYDIDAANYPNIAKITIKGDDIIVPQDVTLNLQTNLESNLRVLGKSCCTGTNGGRVVVKGGKLNNVTMEPTEAKVTALTYDAYNPQVTYSGAAEIVAGKTFDVQAGNVIVEKAVQHKGDIKIAKGAKVTVKGTDEGVNGDLQFMGSTVENNGTIEVKKGGKFDMTDANGNATAEDGKRMTNNGKFIHNIDAGVGTAVQSMVQNGEYRCRVNEQTKLDDAFLQWTACSVIEMVNTGAYSYNLGTAAGITPTAYKHNKEYIDIEVNAGGMTTFDNLAHKTEEINIGNLTVTAGGLTIDYVSTTGSGATLKTFKRTLNVNGDMAVKANTTIKSSQKINVKENLTVEGAGVTLTYKGDKKNIDGLAVTKDIKVSGATFTAGDATYADVTSINALTITCANFYLEKGATAIFANRTDGAAKNLEVSGTISNPDKCTFNIVAANQNGAGSVLAWVTCKKLEVGGNFPGARPRVE